MLRGSNTCIFRYTQIDIHSQLIGITHEPSNRFEADLGLFVCRLHTMFTYLRVEQASSVFSCHFSLVLLN